jgi:hypothetical protein
MAEPMKPEPPVTNTLKAMSPLRAPVNVENVPSAKGWLFLGRPPYTPAARKRRVFGLCKDGNSWKVDLVKLTAG